MKPLRLVSLLLLLVMVFAPFTVFAQGSDKTEWETYTSEDKMISFNYPKDWIVEPAGKNVIFPAYVVGNSQDAADKLVKSDNTPPASGEVGLIMMLMPLQYLTDNGIKFAADAMPGDIAQTLTQLLTAPSSTATPEPTLSAPTEVPLTDALNAGQIHVVATDGESTFTIFTLKEGVIAITWVGTAVGEFTDTTTALGVDFAKSVSYEGTAQDLIDTVTANQAANESAATPPADVTPSASLDGKALVDERCSVCHDTQRIDREIKKGTSLAQWTEIVDEMIANGAQLNAEERQAVLDYLSSAK